MPDKCNTNADSPPPDIPLDSEDWEVAFEPYAGHPRAALTLAFHLTELKRCINGSTKRNALHAIDDALDRLYEHSDFRDVSHELFLSAAAGELTTDTEGLLRQLGIKV
ncbi:MAG TPA: hypothetical protein VFS76_10680 [Pyrinomonadaceae bacterium]|nr:hypothetical protein [Pyrinomonadaceae bacterium]